MMHIISTTVYHIYMCCDGVLTAVVVGLQYI